MKILKRISSLEKYTLDFLLSQMDIFTSATPNRYVSTSDSPEITTDSATSASMTRIRRRKSRSTSNQSCVMSAGSDSIGETGYFMHPIISTSSTSTPCS